MNQAKETAFFDTLQKANAEYTPALSIEERGMIISLSQGVAAVSGLPEVGYEELVEFPGGVQGIAFNLEADRVDVVLLGESDQLNPGQPVTRMGRVVDIPVDDSLIGRVINPLGEPLDGKPGIDHRERYPIERPAHPIMHRAAVNTPLQTGIRVIDALIPIGRGQRELILGDRQTGKTTIALDTIINQRDKNVICVYCAIGQRTASVAKVIATLTKAGAMAYTTVMVSSGDDLPGLRYIAPYAATSIAEYFMEKGKDVLIIYDDLTHHARSYRELSLLLKRPPGREAFPGDIFYIHSRLLERSTHLNAAHGGGSITALPVIETEAQNISAYIPTNLISITDGQLYLSPKLFDLGVMPAVDVGKSVSRVGGKAQLPIFRSVSGNLKLTYAQFEELESFARFGTRMDADTQKIIEHGKRIRECFKQGASQPVAVEEQVFLLLALKAGLMADIPVTGIPAAIEGLAKALTGASADLHAALRSGGKLSDNQEAALQELARLALADTTHQTTDIHE
ncbi:MAG: alternate F1F0 ATPase, F1 subunit alpha [Ilumatobacteraceae bacterium]